MFFSPRLKWNIQQILPFAIIWLLVAWVFLLVEYAAIGDQNNLPDAVIRLSWSVLVFASIAVFIVGLFIGVLEVFFFKALFKKEKFIVRLLAKVLVYTTGCLFIIIITYPIAASIEADIPIYAGEVWIRLTQFLRSVTFLSTMFQMGISLFLCFIYRGLSQHLGYGTMANFLLGKYNVPRLENRVFMFLDMHDSTTLAEKLGNKAYFDLLSDYYNDLSEAIIKNEGEVYQYIGDEIVITWKFKPDFIIDKTVRCYFDMKKALLSRHDYYQTHYGVTPTFKAALHCGQVTTGEIGALKKEIFFTGDVLNVTARIQALATKYNSELLISEKVYSALNNKEVYDFNSLGKAELKGRKESVNIFAVSE